MIPRLLVLGLAGGIAIAAGGWLLAAHSPPGRSAAELMDAVMWSREPIGGAFVLTDQDGIRRTEADFRGKLMLVYFGFTFCPDICPTDLVQMARAVDDLGPDGLMVQPVFVTLDPARDTPAHLREYLAFFHPRFVGLTGDAGSIEAVAAAYRVYHRKVEWPDASGYSIDHSAFIYLMGRDGAYLGFFPPGTSADRISETVRSHLSEARLSQAR